MSRPDDDADYIPLMGEGQDDEGFLTKNTKKRILRESSDHNFLRRFLSTFVICALLVSFLSFFVSGVQFISTYQHLNGGRGLDVDSLRRPSLYMGLDRVPMLQLVLDAQKAAGVMHHGGGAASSTVPAPVTRYSGRPQAISRVNADNPHTSYPQDGWVLLTDKVCMYRALKKFITMAKDISFARISL